jgi:predicted DCC family thiol-disulfide oxidoreductase YuxK
MEDKKIIVFDGICLLCNSFVQFLLKRDKSKQFYFTTAQSTFAQELNKTKPFSMSSLDSVIYLQNGRVLTESTAILSILTDLGGMWRLFVLFKLVPPFIRNAMYRFCARRRYRVFGMRESCMVPDPEWSDRFL